MLLAQTTEKKTLLCSFSSLLKALGKGWVQVSAYLLLIHPPTAETAVAGQDNGSEPTAESRTHKLKPREGWNTGEFSLEKKLPINRSLLPDEGWMCRDAGSDGAAAELCGFPWLEPAVGPATRSTDLLHGGARTQSAAPAEAWNQGLNCSEPATLPSYLGHLWLLPSPAHIRMSKGLERL